METECGQWTVTSTKLNQIRGDDFTRNCGPLTTDPSWLTLQALSVSGRGGLPLFTKNGCPLLPLHLFSLYKLQNTEKGTTEESFQQQEQTMEGRAVAMAVLMMVLALAVIGNSEICNMTEEDLMACKPSVSGSDPVDPPSPKCCSALESADFPCLCSYKTSFLLPSMGIDPNLALQLPEKCNITPAPKCS